MLGFPAWVSRFWALYLAVVAAATIYPFKKW